MSTTVLIRRMIGMLLSALVLAACSMSAQNSAGSALPTQIPPGQATAAPRPTEAQPIEAGPPTSAPAPSPLPQQAATPTAAPIVEPTPIPTEPPPPQPTAIPTAPPTIAPAASPTALATGSSGEEILFLRQGALLAFDLRARTERRITDGVLDFAPSPDGTMIALIRRQEGRIDLWLAPRGGGELRRLTNDAGHLVEATPAWSPDGLALLYASADGSDAYSRTWPEWAIWCRASMVHLIEVQTGAARAFGPGCDPAFSPDGRRIAYAAPPTQDEPGLNSGPTIINSIRLINRLGQNGWDFAKATGVDAPAPNTGRLVYAPAWSPDGAQVVYQRFLGYQALVDISLSEIGKSFEGKGQMLNAGAGWLLPARFAPGGRAVAIVENNYSDARGFGGYDNWSVSVISLDGTREVPLPSGAFTAIGARVDLLQRAQSAAWAPDGSALAVELPPGWRPDLPNDQPLGIDDQPGEIWRWQPGNQPAERLIEGVDFASPLAWLPAR